MCSNKSRPSSIFPQVKIVRVIDFETYYDREYSLSKMTTEEYIRDPRFEVVGFAYQDYNPDGTPIDEEPKWVTGDHAHIWDYLNNALGWGDVAVVAHNTAFDGPILSWQFGVNPAQWCDTLSMSRPYYGLTTGGSLKALAEALEVGVKGTEVENALGKHRTDFTPEEMHRYAEYCKNDVALTGKIFFMLADRLPAGEAYIIDMFMRMRTQPVLEVDVPMLEEWLEDYKASQKDIMKRALKVAAAKSAKVRNKLKEVIAAGDSPRKLFSSNPIFKEILEALGYPVPEKVSPTTGKKIPALGKKDPEFLKFVEERADDELLQTLVAARQQVKSTLLETRAQRFIDMGGRGPLPIPLKYYGAHTGRASGEDKLNFQNMPRGSIIRKAIKAPEGHTLVVVDSGQIEARGVAWVAGEQELLNVFATGGKVYEWMAEKIYGYPINKDEHPTERQVGKVAVLGLGYGMGASKYKDTLKAWADVEIDEAEAQRIVQMYRQANPHIPRYWRMCDDALRIVSEGGMVQLGPTDACRLVFEPAAGDEPAQIRLPNGMSLRYPRLRWDREAEAYKYTVRSGRTFMDKFLWGGVITENIVQALARIVVFDQMAAIEKKLRKAQEKYGGVWQTVLTVHDEVVLCVPEEHAKRVLELALTVMKRPSAWAEGWPLDAEGDVAKRYGEAK